MLHPQRRPVVQSGMIGAVGTISDVGEQAWDDYVHRHPFGTIYHTSAWRNVILQTFGKRTFYLALPSSTGVRGVLPLVLLNGLLTPKMLLSLPYCSYGGVLVDDAEGAQRLLEEASALRAELACAQLEIRNRSRIDACDWRTRQDKLLMQRSLPETPDEFLESLSAKRRSQIKRSLRDGPTVVSGGAELVTDFYSVFARKMRDLGTPVYPRRFFGNAVEQLGKHASLLLVYLDHNPVAAAFLVRWRGVCEIPWAASDAAYNRQAVNMLLYWEAIKRAIESGCTAFDFGRSSPDSGTYKFKRQWGAEPVELHWYVQPGDGTSAEALKNSTSMKLATEAWRRLPLPIANWLGPKITPNLPW